MIHTPVLVEEIIAIFNPTAESRLLDATLGNGGHTKAYLAKAGPGATVVGLDADPTAIATAQQELKEYDGRVTYINKNFANLNDALIGGGIVEPSMFTHILFDLGIGSHQLADLARGFSWQSDTSLNMGYGPLKNLPPSNLPAINHLTNHLGKYPNAIDLIRQLAVSDLAKLLSEYGEERFAKRIANALKQANIETAHDVADVVHQAVPSRYDGGRLNPATRTFQALRLGVNRELEALAKALPQAIKHLAVGGTIAVISFHSLEDRIVKRFFKDAALTVLTKKPIRPMPEEIALNPRARSAKLRAAKNDSESIV